MLFWSYFKPGEKAQQLRTKLSAVIKNCGKRLQTHPRLVILFIVLIILALFMETQNKPSWWVELSESLTWPSYPVTILLLALALITLLFGGSWLRHTYKSILWVEQHWKIFIPLIPLVLILITFIDYISANRNTGVVTAVVVWSEDEKLKVRDEDVAIQYQVSFNNIDISRDGFEFSMPDVPAIIVEAIEKQSPLILEESSLSLGGEKEKCSDILTPNFIVDSKIPPQTVIDTSSSRGGTQILKTGDDKADDKLPIKTSVGTFDVPLRFLLPHIGYREVNIQVTLISHSPDTENIRIDVKDGDREWNVTGPRQDWLQLMKFLAYHIKIYGNREVVDNDSKAVLALSLGNASFQNQNYISALAYYRLAASFRPNDTTIQTMLGLTQYQLGSFSEASNVLEEHVEAYEPASSPINVYLACVCAENAPIIAQRSINTFNKSLKKPEDPQRRMTELDRKSVIGPGSRLSVDPDRSIVYYISGDVAYSAIPTDSDDVTMISDSRPLPSIDQDSSQDIGKAPRQVFATGNGVYYLTRDGLVYFLRKGPQEYESVIDDGNLYINDSDPSNPVLSEDPNHLYTGGIRQIFAKDDFLFLVDRFGRVLRLHVRESTDDRKLEVKLEAVGKIHNASQIFLDDEALYILREDGTVVQISDPQSDLKTAVQLVPDASNREIAAHSSIAYMLRVNGNIWRYTPEPSQERNKLIDAGTQTKGIFAASQGLFVLKDTGEVWLIQNPNNPAQDDVKKLEDIQAANRIAINVTGATLFALEGSDSENLGIRRYSVGTAATSQEPSSIPPTNTLTPTPVPTDTPSPTPMPTDSPTPTSVPTDTPTPVPSCPSLPAHFVGIWEMRPQLGCPVNVEISAFTFQEFEGGILIWQKSPSPSTIYALYHEPKRWETHPDPGPDGPSCPEAEQNGELGPIRGFGTLWCEQRNLREQLGQPIIKEQGLESENNPIQNFENGTVLKVGPAGGFVLYSDGSWEQF